MLQAWFYDVFVKETQKIRTESNETSTVEVGWLVDGCDSLLVIRQYTFGATFKIMGPYRTWSASFRVSAPSSMRESLKMLASSSTATCVAVVVVVVAIIVFVVTFQRGNFTPAPTWNAKHNMALQLKTPRLCPHWIISLNVSANSL